MKISVFITSYNQKTYLIEAIESILAQTLPPHQLIIVDDCSADGSPEVIADYATRFPHLITPVYHGYNQGVAQTRIDALQAVTGDYVTYLDGDDRYLPTKLEKEAQALESQPDAQIAFSNDFYMTADGTHTGIWADGEVPPQGYVFCQTFSRDFPRRTLFCMELVNYQAWKRIGFYDPNLRLYEDWEMRIRLLKHYRVVYHDEPLTETRVHNRGLSNSDWVQHLTAVEYIYRKNIGLLDDLKPSERWAVKRKLGGWIAMLAKRAARQSYEHGSRREALKYCLQGLKYQPNNADCRFLLKMILPRDVYDGLRSIFQNRH